MFKDNELLLSLAAGDSPTGTGDNVSGNILDTGPLGLPTGSGGGSGTNAGRDLGVGSEMWLEILVLAAATSAGTTNMTFSLVTDSTNTIATKNVLVASGLIGKATLIVGYMLRLQLPAVSPSITNPYKRYIAVNYNIATTNLSTGTFESKLVKNIQESDLYQSGFTIA